MTIKVNGVPTYRDNWGNDWEGALSHFGLKLPEDTFEVAATMTIRHVGTIGDAPRQPAPWRPSELGYPYPDLVIPYEFTSLWPKMLIVRNYKLARVNGATRPAAKWVAANEAQRLFGCDAEHLGTRFKDTREDFEIESENAWEAMRILSDATEGGFWDWEDGELVLTDYDDLEEE